jgi:putative peptide zinc metalloprotease protein
LVIVNTTLPQLRDDIRISPFPDGPRAARGEYLVEAGTTFYVVNAAMHRVLAALEHRPATLADLVARCNADGGQPLTEEQLRGVVWGQFPATLFADSAPAARRSPLLVRKTLLRESVVVRVSRSLTWMFTPAAATVVLAFFAASLLLSFSSPSATATPVAGGELVLIVALVLASMLVHELGHASACARFGCPPGEIGAGIYLVFPVMYTDVTRAWRLPPRSRAVVDLGGLYFQSLVVSVSAVYAWQTGSASARWFVWLSMLSMAHMLNPMYKMDGYWLLTDLSGLTNLHDRTYTAIRGGLARLLGRAPRSTAAEAGVQRGILAAYCTLFTLYFILVGRALVTAGGAAVRAYPALATEFSSAVSSAGGHDASTPLLALGKFLSGTFWILIILIALFFLARRVYLLLVPAAPARPALLAPPSPEA